MSTSEAVLNQRIINACSSAAVATQAGIPPATWADPNAPHVFQYLAGFIGGRNRGRLPFIEFNAQTQVFGQETREGGTQTTVVTIRVWVGSKSRDAGGDLTQAILGAALSQIRSQAQDNYFSAGSDTIGALTAGPFGWRCDATMTVEHTFDRTNYGVT